MVTTRRNTNGGSSVASSVTCQGAGRPDTDRYSALGNDASVRQGVARHIAVGVGVDQCARGLFVGFCVGVDLVCIESVVRDGPDVAMKVNPLATPPTRTRSS